MYVAVALALLEFFIFFFLDQGGSDKGSRYENATPNLCWVFCAINKGDFFENAFLSSTHICLALRRLLAICLTLTR